MLHLEHCLPRDKCSKLLGIITIVSEPWDPKIFQYKVSNVTNVLVRNYHKLRELRQ